MICSWFLHPGWRWMPNVFVSSEIGSQWRTILGHPQLIVGICILSLAHGSGKKGFRRYLHYCEKLIWKFFFNFNQGTCPWMAFAWNFFLIFLIFLRGVSGAKFGAQIFPVVWPVTDGCKQITDSFCRDFFFLHGWCCRNDCCYYRTHFEVVYSKT